MDVRCVVAAFRLERRAHLLVRTGMTGCLSQRGEGIDQPDERPERVDRDRVELRERQLTHCQRDHCTTATPSSMALVATIALWMRGRPPTDASARKNGKSTSPKRGSESSGQ